MTSNRTTDRLEKVNRTAFSSLQNYYVLEPNMCPYLEGRLERKLLTEISGSQAQGTYDGLTQAGFRRSHRFAYRPACSHCDACVPVRVLVGQFAPGKSLRRISRANTDLSIQITPARATAEQFELFRHYIESRHGDGEMVGMTDREYVSMIESSDIDTRLAEFRNAEGDLLAVCLLDWLADGLSAVYSFFDPNESRRSLGTYVVLWLIEAAKRDRAAHVYLGYWINGSRKMAYKTRFRPLEGFGATGWQLLAD